MERKGDSRLQSIVEKYMSQAHDGRIAHLNPCREETDEEWEDTTRKLPSPKQDATAATTIQSKKQNKFTRRAEIYRMISVESPFEFYMVLGSDTCLYRVRARALRLLQIMAKSWESDEKDVKSSATLTKFKVYGFYDKVDQSWKRVRLLECNDECGQALVYFLDEVARAELVPQADLKPIDDNYIASAGIVPLYRCYLSDVIPVDGNQVWSKDACDWFRLQVNRNSSRRNWMALQLSFERTYIHGGPDSILNIGVVLFEDSPKCFQSVNWRIVNVGHAKAVGIGANPPQMPYAREEIPYFDYEEDPTDYDSNLAFEGTIPKPAAVLMSQVAIVHVKGPDCIYVRNIDKMSELRALEKKIGEVIEENGVKSLEHSKAVELQLVFYLTTEDTENDKLKNFRAVIIRVYEQKVEILAVDYGYRIVVPASRLYPMPIEFVTIPAYIHRVHMNTICPLNSEIDCWPEAACKEFKEAIEKVENDLKPAFFPLRADALDLRESIVLRDLDQGIRFDHAGRKWIAQDMEMKPEENGKTLHTPQLLAHIISYAADFGFVRKTKKSGDSGRWHLRYLSELSVEGIVFVKPDGKRVEWKIYYAKLCHWRDRFWKDFLGDGVTVVIKDERN